MSRRINRVSGFLAARQWRWHGSGRVTVSLSFTIGRRAGVEAAKSRTLAAQISAPAVQRYPVVRP
jgi:hypothetical protein